MASLVPGAAARSKKRPASPGNGSGPSKKKKVPAAASGPQLAVVRLSVGTETMNENKFMTVDPNTGPMEAAIKPLPFKDSNFIVNFTTSELKPLISTGMKAEHSGIGGAAAGKKNRTWKNLKQILASERALPWQLNDPSYFNIEAPPSFKPAKKYSDISGLPANYTDPQSKLRFSSIEEFAYIRMLPSDVVTGYLALRKATSIVP
ncbi:INO80 complex subunit C isoform X1 [Dermochelys coriacea]|uniref:INO80 complex subunit C isoform X1 n=2 Tax=Dermochelys coriacea TaxID=27794 RepID=UPI001CA90F3B|nr:INO80 complex subunit C isoform X1 [Dermochelys coriacea]